MPPITVLIKNASSLCNISCKYCFYRDASENRNQKCFGIMTKETLEQVMSKMLDYAEKQCTFSFQGGEPTVAGLAYFKEVLELEKKHNLKGLRIENSIQTNGLLIDDEWARFFHDNSFLVGVSLDGTNDTHDAFRVDAQGKGTHTRVMQAISLLRKHDADFNILTVVNSVTARHIASIYNFYRKNDFKYLQFIPVLDPIGEEPKEYSLTNDRYSDFLCTLFDLWYYDYTRGDYISIRYFDNLIGMLLGQPPEACGMSGICTMQYVVEADGSVYPCDFYALDSYRLGSLATESIEHINGQRSAIGFIEESQQLNAQCQSCRYLYMCRGGCKRDRVQLPDDTQGLNRYCEANKRFFDYAMPRLSQVAQDISMQR